MLYLPDPSDETLEYYYDSIKKRVETALDNSNLIQAAKSFFSEQKIKEIVLSKPAELLDFHNQIIPYLSPGFSIANFDNYIIVKRKKQVNRTLVERQLVTSYDNPIKELKKVFNYDKFISKHKITSYWPAKQLNRNTCTYCNRREYLSQLGKALGKINK